MKKTIFLIIAIGFLIAVILAITAKAEGIGISIQGDSAVVNVTLNNIRDSAWVIFSMPDDNPYDSIKVVPKYAGKRFLESITPFSLDSIGSHSYLVKAFLSDTWIDTLIGQWVNLAAINLEAGSGYKTYNCNLYVLNSADSTAISGASVTIRPVGGGKEFVISSTDVNGLLQYSSEAESIAIYLNAQGWDFNAIDTLVIAAAQTDSLWGTAFAPSSGPADMVNIFCWTTTPGGDTIDPSFVKYRIVAASDSTAYGRNVNLTVGTGANKTFLSKQFRIEESDTSYIAFRLHPNCNIYVDGVQDTSTVFEFIGYFQADEGSWETRVILEIPDTTSYNPFAQ